MHYVDKWRQVQRILYNNNTMKFLWLLATDVTGNAQIFKPWPCINVFTRPPLAIRNRKCA